jgi:hypothetical protein
MVRTRGMAGRMDGTIRSDAVNCVWGPLPRQLNIEASKPFFSSHRNLPPPGLSRRFLILKKTLRSRDNLSNSTTLLADRDERKLPSARERRMREGRGFLIAFHRPEMLLQGRGAQLPVGCARPPRRPILCWRHSERGFEQSAKMGGIIVTPPIGNLGYGGLGIRSVQFGSAT